ncbi:MAG: gamma-glutamylcyclotransferase [Kofleriaceae bacterium]|nr:gamma-glutamylcyclotransferase [Myxococcales bacterium]MCB9572274.1 gamma-glutamylcyclotransferase [Kofleriaceae bacterium]
MSDADDVTWVFGYGSLVWRPGFAHVARRAARVRGWTRRFWLESTDHRGTVDAPGRVLTLLPDHDATLWGRAYAVAAAAWPEVRAGLEIREQQGYDAIELDAELAAGDRVGPIAARRRVVTYVATAANRHFVGPEAPEVTAAIVRTSVGPSGDNRTYVTALAAALAEMGAPDPEVEAMARLLADGPR